MTNKELGRHSDLPFDQREKDMETLSSAVWDVTGEDLPMGGAAVVNSRNSLFVQVWHDPVFHKTGKVGPVHSFNF